MSSIKSKMKETPNCPDCHYPLSKVVKPADSVLTAELYDMDKPGDYYCTKCLHPGTENGYQHFWMGYKNPFKGSRKDINIKEFGKLMNYLLKYHGFRLHENSKSPHIKYIRPTFDTRDRRVFGMYLGEEEFFIVNENRNKDLLAWIAEYLGTTKEAILSESS